MGVDSEPRTITGATVEVVDVLKIHIYLMCKDFGVLALGGVMVLANSLPYCQKNIMRPFECWQFRN